jgi:serine phosphatase RsbU (regulator of sigma subunit)
MRLIKNGEHGLSAEIVSGGHPLPLLIGGEAPVPLGEPGTLLGVVENPDLPVFRATIPPLSAVVLYTDGLSAGQSTDDTAFAANLIRDIHVNGNADLAAEIDQAAHDTQLEPNRDDVAILVARVLG